MVRMRICVSVFWALWLPGLAIAQELSGPPAWAEDAIWYQIFVERFRNGDPTNDPTLNDMEGSWPHMQPDGWEPTPWTHDWYRQEDWAVASGEPFYRTVQMRRYGGDLQGVLDKMDYLQDLGVTALYFNPLNDSPSLHKYDARHYRHIDRNFGPDPSGDAQIMASEDPLDPSTWQWTAADELFLKVIEEAHQRDIRVIMDYSWNHTGITFWAWQDILENQQASPYADWYDISAFDDPATPDTNEFAYDGWLGVKTLPELAEVVDSGVSTLHPEVTAHVYNVTRRWLDPNGDGNPDDGVDGFRLDVAEMVPLGFWRDYRTFVRTINPDAYLVGEVWWDSWPHHMTNPAPWLQGDVFDAVMNYRWYMPTRSFFAQAPPHLTASDYVAHLDSISVGYDRKFWNAMMNLTASHDSPRVGTSIYNPGLYKYRMSPNGHPEFNVDRPDARARAIQAMILVQQFTWPGAPHIWNGDEVGMWGGDDPDVRKPLLWRDLNYEDETTHPFGIERRHDVVAPDLQLLAMYKQLIDLRKSYMQLWVDGEAAWPVVDDARRVVAYSRAHESDQAMVIFNASDEAQSVDIPHGTYRQIFPLGAVETLDRVDLPPLSAIVLLAK